MTLAVSGCLLGEHIRFDAGHKHDRFITDELGRYTQFISFCPEHLAFGSPRESMRLVVTKTGGVTVESNQTHTNLTQALTDACVIERDRLKAHKLTGIILKAKSPSCGLGSAKAYLDNGFAEGKTDGLFAALCKQAFPYLPIEEEGRLQDAWLRENFVMQLFAYEAFENFKTQAVAINDLVLFHQSYKFLLQSKSEKEYRALGKIVGNHDKVSLDTLIERYEPLFKTAIAHKSSIKKTRNVLEHMAGFLKTELSAVEKATLHEQIGDFAQKILPLIVPLSTLHLFAQKYQNSYLLDQKFLNPYPKELALRSDVKSGK